MTSARAGQRVTPKHRGDYGVDGPPAGLLGMAAGALTAATLAAAHRRKQHRRLAAIELCGSLLLALTLATYVHTTRRGKFLVWAELLENLELRGDERVLDMGCGRGAVLAMVARLLPHGQAVGLDLWTADQSGNSPEATIRNLEAEGVRGRCQLQTGDMTAMPFPDGAFDVVVSSMAIHNVDAHQRHTSRRSLQAVEEAMRVLKPGGRLLIADFLTPRYAQHLRDRGLTNVQQRSLGWRFWYGPGVGAGLVTATRQPG